MVGLSLFHNQKIQSLLSTLAIIEVIKCNAPVSISYLSAPNDLNYCGKRYILDKGAYLWFFPYSLPSAFLVFMKNTIGITNLRK